MSESTTQEFARVHDRVWDLLESIDLLATKCQLADTSEPDDGIIRSINDELAILEERLRALIADPAWSSVRERLASMAAGRGGDLVRLVGMADASAHALVVRLAERLKNANGVWVPNEADAATAKWLWAEQVVREAKSILQIGAGLVGSHQLDELVHEIRTHLHRENRHLAAELEQPAGPTEAVAAPKTAPAADQLRDRVFAMKLGVGSSHSVDRLFSVAGAVAAHPGSGPKDLAGYIAGMDNKAVRNVLPDLVKGARDREARAREVLPDAPERLLAFVTN